jgi:hypothetical protein
LAQRFSHLLFADRRVRREGAKRVVRGASHTPRRRLAFRVIAPGHPSPNRQRIVIEKSAPGRDNRACGGNPCNPVTPDSCLGVSVGGA